MARLICAYVVIGMDFISVNLSMCKLHQITHKLSKQLYVKFVSDSPEFFHIDKIHKKTNSFLIIPNFSSKSFFC